MNEEELRQELHILNNIIIKQQAELKAKEEHIKLTTKTHKESL